MLRKTASVCLRTNCFHHRHYTTPNSNKRKRSEKCIDPLRHEDIERPKQTPKRKPKTGELFEKDGKGKWHGARGGSLGVEIEREQIVIQNNVTRIPPRRKRDGDDDDDRSIHEKLFPLARAPRLHEHCRAHDGQQNKGRDFGEGGNTKQES